jgi:Outer membrane protein beta-barrel domain
LSVLGFSLVPDKSTSVTNTAGTVTNANDTTGSSSRIGYGLIGQVRITNHFSIDVNPLYRRIGYQFTNTVTSTTTSILNGITTSTTGVITTHEDNRAHLVDIPVVLRYYGSPRRPRGPRWFLEAGGAWRVATGIRTSTDVTNTSDVNTCCTFTPTTPAHRSAIGVVAGAGFQFIDPLGIHVVPEVRYTRWEEAIFDNLTTTMRGNQLEATISLSF